MDAIGGKCIRLSLGWGILVCCCPIWAANDKLQQVVDAPHEAVQNKPLLRSYTVNKNVADFPPARDLSSPESAYATIMRDFMATGASPSEWSEISLWKANGTERISVSAERAANYLNAYICEVIVYKDRLALAPGGASVVDEQ